MQEELFLFPVNVEGKLKYPCAIFPARDIRYPRNWLYVDEVFCLEAIFPDLIFNMAKAYKAVYILSPATFVSGKNKQFLIVYYLLFNVKLVCSFPVIGYLRLIYVSRILGQIIVKSIFHWKWKF